MKTNIEELKRLAEDALWTGRWYDGGCETMMGTYGDDSESCEGHGEIVHPVPLGIVPYLVGVQPAAVLELIRQRDEMLEALKDAREMVSDWGGYASPYFQEKHDIDGDLKKLDDAITKAEG